MQRFCVAGGSGMVGRALLRRIHATFPHISLVSTFYSQQAPLYSNEGTWIPADLRREEDACRAISGCDTVLCAAAITGGSAILNQDPWAQVHNNVRMYTSLFSACMKEKVKQLIFISSASVYQEHDGAIAENDLDLNADPHAAYFGVGWTMRYCEKLCKLLSETSNCKVIVVRAANIFGEYAKFDPQTSNVIPALMRKAIAKMDPFEIWGSPTVERDVLYADDFADAIIALMQTPAPSYDCYNVGTGSTISVNVLARQILAAAGHFPKDISYGKDAPATIAKRYLSIEKLIAKTAWQPQIGVSEGLIRTTQWWKENCTTWNR